MVPKTLPSQAYLRECFRYNQKTGAFVWRHRPRDHFKTHIIWKSWNRQNAGVKAGHVNTGYLKVCVGGTNNIGVHRVVWKMVTGKDAPETIDHKNGRRDDNRFCNLRLATRAQQRWNAKVQKGSTTGVKGVAKSRNKFRAAIRIGGRTESLGTFATAKSAASAYRKASKAMHGEFRSLRRASRGSAGGNSPGSPNVT